ncbi:MAG: ATP-binding protein [Kineosporiaceae bacterium]|jgi:serine/threonine-protein kinase RsbW
MTPARSVAEDGGDTVDLRVPADPAYLAVIRTAAAGLAARLELTLDEIEDLRIAVDEACALLLDRRSHPGGHVEARFTIHPDVLEVVVSGPAQSLPERSSFAWTVLEALVGKIDTWTTTEGSWIRLTHDGSRRTQ